MTNPDQQHTSQEIADRVDGMGVSVTVVDASVVAERMLSVCSEGLPGRC